MVAPADKRADINRRNAQHSTGPRTEAGKGRSSMNAVKHGLTAQAALLRGEDAEELRLFAQSLEAGLRPMGPLQKILVQRIVAIAWKLQRVAAAEVEAAQSMDASEVRKWERGQEMKRQVPFAPVRLGPHPEPRTGGRLLADSFREFGPGGATPVDGALIRITTYELKLEGALRATMRELRALQREDPFPAPEEPEGERVPEPAPAPENVAGVVPAVSAPQAGRLNGNSKSTVDVGDAPATAVDDGTHAPRSIEPTGPAPRADGNPSEGAGP